MSDTKDFVRGVRATLALAPSAIVAKLAERGSRIENARAGLPSTLTTVRGDIVDAATRAVLSGAAHTLDGKDATAKYFDAIVKAEDTPAVAFADWSANKGALPKQKIKVRARSGAPVIPDGAPRLKSADAAASAIEGARAESIRNLRRDIRDAADQSGAMRKATIGRIRAALKTWADDREVNDAAHEAGWGL